MSLLNQNLQHETISFSRSFRGPLAQQTDLYIDPDPWRGRSKDLLYKDESGAKVDMKH